MIRLGRLAAAAFVAAVVAWVPSAAGDETPVVAASAKQTRVVREIVSGLGSPPFRRVAVVPAGRLWRPVPRGGVTIKVSGVERSRRRAWEASLLAGAFQERSLVEGLPPVVALETERDGLRMWGDSSWRPRLRDDLPLIHHRDRLTEIVTASAAQNGAALRRLDVLRPHGFAAALVVLVSDPGSFLLRRLWPFLGRLPKFEDGFDGYFVRVLDEDGEFVAEISAAYSLSLISGGSHARPEFEGCLHRTLQDPDDPPPPCPA